MNLKEKEKGKMMLIWAERDVLDQQEDAPGIEDAGGIKDAAGIKFEMKSFVFTNPFVSFFLSLPVTLTVVVELFCDGDLSCRKLEVS